MNLVTERDFIIRQPSFPDRTETDGFYIGLANQLADRISDYSLVSQMPDGLLKRLVLTMTDYMQDIVADCGLWRSFVVANRALYGWSVPFHDIPEDYVDFELNREDVRFLAWYVVAMLWEEKKGIAPHAPELLEVADKCYELLTEVYDEAPLPEAWGLARGLELNDPEDHKEISRLANWLFLHSYLLTPAFAVSLRELTQSIDPKDPDAPSKLNSALDDAMYEDSTGPLALFTPEWVYLMLEGKLPDMGKAGDGNKGENPYYTAFTKYTGGKPIAYFDSYESMNEFFISALGWAQGEEHLAQVKGAHDYVLLVNPAKGLLMARDVARCLKDDDNPMYDALYAAATDFSLISERGCCPADLVRYALAHGMLPDLKFPGDAANSDALQYADVLARCFLQFYYRD